MHWSGFTGMGFGGFGWIFMVLFWVLIIAGIVYLVKLIFSGNSPSGLKESAEDIVKKRYAQGEISKEEFEEKLRDLRHRLT